LPKDEALTHLVKSSPKEIADAFERNRRRADEIERSAGERRERLRGATASPKKKFGL
jgi:hypothetical protein